MERAEAIAMEGAILWRAQTILESLVPAGELDAWLSRVGLAGAAGELKSEVERMETVVNGVKGRAVGNKPLARSLARVKELMYEADDVVDELDYCRLQQKVEGVIAPAIDLDGMVGDGAEQVDASVNTVAMLAPAIEPEGMVGDGAEHIDASANTAGTSDNNGRKNRSKERDYFHITPAVNGEPAKAKCIDCGTEVVFSHGTSVLRKHRNSASCKKKRAAIEEAPNCPSAGDSVQNCAIILDNTDSGCRKRMRTESNAATATHPWDKANFLKRIHEIALELGSNRGYVIEYLKDSVASFDQYQGNNSSDTGVRTSGSRPGKMYGRYCDKCKIMSVIKAANSDNITVLPIVGIVGVGKTALAKLVYNDLLVKNQFERIWVWVSNIFDEVRVAREILDVVILNSHEGSPGTRESYGGVSNNTKLQEVLKNHMACLHKKFLLVLDDVNDCMDDSRWKDLLDALGSSCTKGNVIIVTARNFSIAKRLGTTKPVILRALKKCYFLPLFKECIFGDNHCIEDPHINYDEIASQLNGNPLAAESAAEMLREQPTLGHWNSIIRNGVWESLQLRGGIVTTLKISYYQMPYQLQQCFIFCSIFPNGHRFHIDDLISMWISSGFVKSIETGRDHFNALVNSCLLEEVDPILVKKYYVICGMMHEFARLVSRTEFATIDGLDCEKVLPTVRHLLIRSDRVTTVDNVKFQQKLQSIAPSFRRLRTLIFIGSHFHGLMEFQYLHTCISNLVNCTHLRYLKLEYEGLSESLAIPLRNFYHLEMLDARGGAIVRDICASSPAWSCSLQTIHLEDCKGWNIFPSLESLSSLTRLKLRKMPEVTELLIPSLKELVLIDMPKLETCSSNSVRDLNLSLRLLEIRTCWVLKVFPPFESCEIRKIKLQSWLPNVSELTIHECPHLTVSNPLPPSSRFCKLSIKKVSALPEIEGSSDIELRIGSSEFTEQYSIGLTLDNKILSFHNLRTIAQLEIVRCENLWSFSLEGFRQLVCLKRFKIEGCPNFFSSDVPSTHMHEDMADTDFDALPSLECLDISNSGITGQWLSVILQHVRALEELHVLRCKEIRGLLIEGKENSLSNLTWSPRASSQGNQDDASTRSCPDKLLCVPFNLVPSLKKVSIDFGVTKFKGNKEGFAGFTSLEELRITLRPELKLSLVHEDKIEDQANGTLLLPCSLGVLCIYGASLETLQPCFPRDMTRLTVLELCSCYGLKSLQLHSCTALEELRIVDCESLDALEGFQSLRGLRYLKVYVCPGLPQCLKNLSTQGYELCPRLERLRIDDPSFLTMPFCKHLTSLQCLQLVVYRDIGLTREQEAALELLKSLQQLRFQALWELSDLPVSLHSLPSLKRLDICFCPGISMLPERGLPPSLEELEVWGCSEELAEQCRTLATSKLKVIIDGKYVN